MISTTVSGPYGAPDDLAVRLHRIVVGAKNGDIMCRRQLPTQLEGVYFRARLVPRQEIVNGVKDPQRGDYRITVAPGAAPSRDRFEAFLNRRR